MALHSGDYMRANLGDHPTDGAGTSQDDSSMLNGVTFERAEGAEATSVSFWIEVRVRARLFWVLPTAVCLIVWVFMLRSMAGRTTLASLAANRQRRLQIRSVTYSGSLTGSVKESTSSSRRFVSMRSAEEPRYEIL